MKKIWLFLRHHFRRLTLFVTDMAVVTLVYFAGWYVFQGQAQLKSTYFVEHWFFILVCMAVPLFFFRSYESLWRYADSREYITLFGASVMGFLLYFTADRLLIPKEMHYSCRFMLLVVLISLVGMWLLRFMWRLLRQARAHRQYAANRATPVVIIGAGDAGVDLAEEIKRDRSARYYIYGFFDDNPSKQHMKARDIPVLGTVDELPEKLKGTGVEDIILAIPSIDERGQKRILEICSKTGCRVRLLPRLSEWMQNPAEGGGLFGHVRDVQVEDLLGRAPVVFDNKEVYDFLKDKVVMVTGGGGSIGSELCRQIAMHEPKTLIVLDIYENNAYDLQQELRLQFGDRLDLRVEIASVRDQEKVRRLFARYRPHIVFHAAAHKHVPLMENCPEEAIKNNVFGTYHVALAAREFGAEKCILISTDKAVNPTNVMGASKRMCEMIMQCMQSEGGTKFVAVRFGNVLGSNGSVIPLFKKQVERGGPLTVTDRRIIRYFMTIPEAVQLVMQAGAMAENSEIFVLDMGEPVKIWDLAENLIRLSGYQPYEDIDIVETGLRPGEKLYEELLVDNDRLAQTKYNKIYIEQREQISGETMERDLQRLRDVLETQEKDAIVALMREIVPTFHTPEEVNGAAVVNG